MKLGGAVKYAAGLLLTALLLGWVLRRTEPAAVVEQLGRASWIGLGAAMLLNFGHNLFRVWRWRVLLTPVRPGLPLRSLFAAVVLGYMTSWVVPGRLGELVRPALVAARERLPLGPCLGTVVVDRLLDGIAVLALFGVGIVATPLAAESREHAALIRGGLLLLLALIALPLGVLLVAAAGRRRIEARIGARSGARAWLGRTVLSLSEGLDALRRPGRALRIAVHTAGAWLMIAVATWIGVRACGAEVSFGAILVLLPLLVMGIALPTPGGAGGYHAAMTFGLTRMFGVPNAVAVGASLLMHLVIVLPVVIVGVGLLLVDRVSFGDVVRAGRTLGAAGRAGETPS
jgi:uncharacterized protein (TIRG00374 family)